MLADLAATEHIFQGSLLGRADGQAVGALDLDPGAGIGAVEAGQRGLPLVGALVTLALVDLVGDGP